MGKTHLTLRTLPSNAGWQNFRGMLVASTFEQEPLRVALSSSA